MPLILAIEPDRRQASQLTAMVRERLGAELVLADSAERALASLGSRVPDLILTSALLSTKDEAALADRLRSLETAAAHVQTLTIPVLDTPRPRSNPARGMLSALLGDRQQPESTPDGCDPAVFADQCGAYLERAEAEKHTLQNGRSAGWQDGKTDGWQDRKTEESGDPEIEVDLAPLLDESVVEQLTAAMEAVDSNQHVDYATSLASIDASAIEPAPVRPQPKARKERARLTEVSTNFFDPSECGFAALLAKLDEITHLASPLPGVDPLAGSFDATR